MLDNTIARQLSVGQPAQLGPQNLYDRQKRFEQQIVGVDNLIL